MTCIVGIETDSGVIMGADSCGSDENYHDTYKNPKLFKVGDLLIGWAGPYRMGQIVEYHFQEPARSTEWSDFDYIVKGVVVGLMATLVEHGHNIEDEPGRLLVGYNGKLYMIDTGFAALSCAENYAAIGAGEMVAKGVMFAMRKHKSPKEAVRAALEAAERYCIGVRGPFTILSS